MARRKLSSEYNLQVVSPLVAKEWHPSRNGELSPKDVTPKSNQKVWWQCKKGHEWQTAVSHRCNGTGCPYCSGRNATKENSLASVNKALATEWHPTKNGDLTPDDVLPGSNRKVWWRCSVEKDHEWKASVVHRSQRGHGCPFCSGHKASRQNSLASVIPDLAKEWHPKKNGNLTPDDVTAGSGKKVWWLCKNGHEWQAFINNRSKGIGCPYCSNKKACKDNCLATINPKLAKEWHPTKNGKLTPQHVLPSSNKKVWWQCKKGHEWETLINNRSAGKDCPYCAGQKVCKDNCLATINPKLVKEWHPTKNGALTSEDVMPNSDKKVWWQCKKGHEWKTAIKVRNKGIGCPYCSNKKTNEDNCLATINPALTKEWHPIKNGTLTANKVTPGSNQQVWWQCKRGHEWKTTVSSRNAGTGCPKCCSATSQLELRVYTELKHLFGEVKHRKKMFRLECDIYIPEIRCAIEIDGAYWHKSKTRKDEEKNRKLQEKGIFLLRVRGYGLNRIAEQDILLPQKIGSFEVVQRILNSIKDHRRLEENCEEKIDKYIQERKLKNQKEYKEILYMLPGPLPGKSLADLNISLAGEWHPNKNGTLTARSVAIASNKKVWWQCTKGHEWEATVASRSSGNGCPYCGGQRVTKETSLAVKKPDLAKEWHPTKNGKLTPHDVMVGAGKIVWWLCEKGHEWQAKINNRNHGRKCPYCSNKKACEDNCLATINPTLAKEWHPTKNGTLTPQNVQPGTNKKVWWRCGEGHEWQAVISHRNRGSGCCSCYNNRQRNRIYANKENCLATVNGALAKEWHPTKNGDLTPKDVKPFSNKKVWWKCPKGHEWETTVNHRSNGQNCPYCSGRRSHENADQLTLF